MGNGGKTTRQKDDNRHLQDHKDQRERFNFALRVHETKTQYTKGDNTMNSTHMKIEETRKEQINDQN